MLPSLFTCYPPAMHHFLAAQDPVYETVLAELLAGEKRSHWMWFIFPQVAGLGHSEMSRRYALSGLGAARQYHAHPVLGARLTECTRAVLGHKEKSAHDIFGSPDDFKFRSSMTLFAEAVPEEPVFGQALDAFYTGARDPETLIRL
ncbi:DUF1810 domain-containing protein [Pelagibacterium limicola]|uniref:DUF1810 domain-containing protein n=1 Tax=Pelagibacterium limicola TaxID=2791022 RepID=UPI0018AFA3EC|nr:DUF1810 domain-containing protein [Pelagibacterium limicola]